MKIYLASALSHVPREYFDQYIRVLQNLATHVRSNEYCSDIRYALEHSDPQLAKKPFHKRAELCYFWDKQMVEWADVLISELSFPSTGAGIELDVAARNEKPSVIIFSDYGNNRVDTVEYTNPDGSKHNLQVGEGYVSLMALGAPTVYSAIYYENEERLRSKIDAILRELSK